MANTAGSIANGNIVYAGDYNVIHTTIKDILATSYGATDMLSNPVSVGNLITALQWTNLVSDYRRIYVHINGTAPTFTNAIPAAGDLIQNEFVNELYNKVVTANSNKYNIAVGQSETVSLSQGTSTRTSVWNSTITHIVDFRWPLESIATNFFNLGGKITDNFYETNGSGSSDDNNWIALIGLFQTDLVGKYYGRTEYAAGGTQTIVTRTTANGTITLTGQRMTMTDGSYGVRMTLTLNTLSTTPTINLDVTNEMKFVYSRANAGVSQGSNTYYGVGAIQPTVVPIQSLGNAGAVIFVAKKTIYSPTTPSDFTFTAGGTSPTQTVTISNIGNTPFQVSEITYSTTGGVTAVPVYGFSFPLTLYAPGGGTSSQNFTVAYTGATSGTYNNTINVACNADNVFVVGPSNYGQYTISTKQVIGAQAFDFTLSPSTLSPTTTSPVDYVTQKFTIVPTGGSYTNFDIQLSNTSGAFIVGVNSSDGPTVSFNPRNLPNGNYATNVTVTITGTNAAGTPKTVVRTATFGVVLAAIQTKNIGKWISAYQNYNGVIGASYDIISGIRYLTLGYGMGTDGVQFLYNGGQAYVDVNNLGIDADTKFDQGKVLYPVLSDGNHCAFLRETGAWVHYNTGDPRGTTMIRAYKFTAPVAGTYTWSFSADNYGAFNIDGGEQLNQTSDWRYEEQGEVVLTSGEHTVNFSIGGDGRGPTGIAIRLKAPDGTMVWSTRNPVRDSTPYPYWNEVYRIPLTKTASASSPATYQSVDYLIKESGSVEWGGELKSYGDFFANRSMFTVKDYSNGNVEITVNPAVSNPADSIQSFTTRYTEYLPYYYSTLPSTRLTQLESPFSTTGGTADSTKFFTGFAADGTVTTVTKTYPYVPTGGGGGGGGCPDPAVPILMADKSTKPAGEIQVGELLYTMHEHTREFGEFPVSAVEIEEQPMVDITFTDNTNLSVSRTHKFLMATGEWKQVFELGQGDVIKGVKTDKTIQNIVALGLAPAVKLTVADAHTYIADGLVSHNIKIIENFTILLQ